MRDFEFYFLIFIFVVLPLLQWIGRMLMLAMFDGDFPGFLFFLLKNFVPLCLSMNLVSFYEQR